MEKDLRTNVEKVRNHNGVASRGANRRALEGRSFTRPLTRETTREKGQIGGEKGSSYKREGRLWVVAKNRKTKLSWVQSEILTGGKHARDPKGEGRRRGFQSKIGAKRFAEDASG